MTKTQLHDAKTSDLIAFYNSKAAKPVKKFADRATAIARCEQFATEPKVAKKAPASETNRNSFKDEGKIVLADKERAEKMHETSRRYASLQIALKAKTVAKYIEQGGTRLDLHKMVSLGIVRVEDVTPAAAAA